MQKINGLKRIVIASVHSLNGFKAAFQFETAFRQELLFFSLLFVSTFLLPITAIEQVLMLACLGLVLIVELLNSAIECVCDRITTSWDPLIKRAKDYGSLAVLICLLITAAIWLVILMPKSGL